MTSPALAIARRSEKAIHHARERVVTRVVQESLNFRGRWRQAREVESRAPDQITFPGRTRRFQAFGLETGEHKCIDRRFYPSRISDAGNSRIFGRDESPKFLWLLLELGSVIAGPGRSHGDPLGENRDFRIR